MDFLEKAERRLSKRIWNKIQSTKENPHHFFERLEGRTDYTLRIGDYRVIDDLDDGLKRIEVTHVGHRKNVYKNL